MSQMSQDVKYRVYGMWLQGFFSFSNAAGAGVHLHEKMEGKVWTIFFKSSAKSTAQTHNLVRKQFQKEM